MASILWPILTVLLIRQSWAQTMDPLYMSLGTPLERNTSRVLTMLLNGYDKRLRPNYGGDPVKVNVSMMVYSIGPINEQKMEYTVDMYFRTEWYDPRLTYTELDTSLSLNAEMVDKVWVPDTYFVNEKDARFHNVISKNSLIRLTPLGHLLFSTRITVVASCTMDLAYFPMDKQRCHLILESYAYSEKDIQFKWLTPTETAVPIWVEDKISLPQFKVLGYNNLEHTIAYYGEPVKVNASMMVYSIGPINEVLMEYTVDMYFRTEWFDPRLTYTEIDRGLNLNAEMVDKVWVPDTYFVNEKDARFHDVIAKNSLIRLQPTGRILFSTRITVIASCGMDLAYFPMDKQRCHLVLESYAYSDKDIQFKWIENGPIWVDSTISLPQFTILGYNNLEHTAQYYVGNYSQLHATFYLGREISYYLIQAYMPATLIVVVSWLSFWIHRTATPARVALGITTVLTMTTLMGNAGSSLPKLSYVKSIDIYLGMCYFYVFSALLEFSIVCYFDKPRFKEARARRDMINRSGCGLMERRSVLRMNAGPTEADEIDVALDGNRATGPVGKNNGSRYTQVRSSSSSPYHRPNKSSHPPNHPNDDPHSHPPPMGVMQDFHRYSECADDQEECCHLECCQGLKSVKETGCDPGKIDKNSRVFFPITFLMLSILYWTYYQLITDVTVDELIQEDLDRLGGA